MVKNLPANTGDTCNAGLIPGSKGSPGDGTGNPLQYSCLKNPTHRGAWQATIHGPTELDITATERARTDIKKIIRIY